MAGGVKSLPRFVNKHSMSKHGLSSRDLDRLRDSYGEIARDPTAAGLVFYEHLFRIDPPTKDLFVASVEDMAPRIINMLGLLVAHIQSGENLDDILGDLALRHVAYGVRPDDYGSAGAALIEMLKDRLAGAMDPELEGIWNRTYRTVSNRMVELGYSGQELDKRGSV